MPLRLGRVKVPRGNLQVGDIVRPIPPPVVLPPVTPPVDPTDPGNPPTPTSYPALRAGLPAGASIFDPATNVYKIRADTYTGPLHPQNDAIVAELARQIAARNGGNATMNTYQYNAHTWLVAPGTPTVEVRYKKWENPAAGLKPPMWETFSTAVPWPDNAAPSLGNDRAIILYKPDTRELWEFWKVRPAPGRPGSENYYNAPYDAAIGGPVQASWGGYMADVSLNRGVFDDDARGYHYGTSATSLAYAGCAISVADVLSGSIDHAIAVQVTAAAPYSQRYWPALRSDGGTAGNPIREGQRFRFPPDMDIDALTGLNSFSRMVMRAIQKYGVLVTDKAGTVAFPGESGGVNLDDTGKTVNPWTAGKFYPSNLANYNVLRNIPWSQLQAMPIDYGKPA